MVLAQPEAAKERVSTGNARRCASTRPRPRCCRFENARLGLATNFRQVAPRPKRCKPAEGIREMPSLTVESWWSDQTQQGGGHSIYVPAARVAGYVWTDRLLIASNMDGADGASGTNGMAEPEGSSVDPGSKPPLRLQLGAGGGVATPMGGFTLGAYLVGNPGPDWVEHLALRFEAGLNFGLGVNINFGGISFGGTDTGGDFQVRAAGDLGPVRGLVGLLSSNDLNLQLRPQLGLGLGGGIQAVGSYNLNPSTYTNMFGQMFLGWLYSQGLPVSGWGN